MQSVFLLWHSNDLGDGETDDKLLGVYSGEAEAEAAKARKLQVAGFRDAPDGFLIARYELDRDEWLEGFVTVYTDETNGASDEPNTDADSRTMRRFSLALFIRHPSMDPAAISAALGLEAHFAHRAGDPRTTPKGTRLPGIYPRTDWRHCIRWEVDSSLFVNELSEFVGSLAPYAAFLGRIRGEGGETCLIVSFLGDGYFCDQLPPGILQTLADLRLELGIDCYAEVQSCSKGVFRRRVTSSADPSGPRATP